MLYARHLEASSLWRSCFFWFWPKSWGGEMEAGLVSRDHAVIASANLLSRLRHFHPDLDPRRKKQKSSGKSGDSHEPIMITGMFGSYKWCVNPRPITLKRDAKISEIIRAVCEHYKVSAGDLLSERRPKEIVVPRHVAMYLARKLTGRSLPYIGSKLGNRDHTTVLHGVRKIERTTMSNPDLAQDVQCIMNRIARAA